MVSLYNRGRGAITVDSIKIADNIIGGSLRYVSDKTVKASQISGNRFPVRIEGHSGEQFKFTVDYKPDRSRRFLVRREYVFVLVKLGSGRTLNLRAEIAQPADL
jgi:hypothetical protein